jgi:hypothetical protein
MKDPLHSAPPKPLRSHQTNVNKTEEQEINPAGNKSSSISNSRFIIFQSLF